MKSIFFTLPAFIYAQDETPETDIDGKKFSAIVRFTYSQVTTSLDISVFNKRVQNYGCHCFGEGSRTVGGQGPPVDTLDSICRDLARCHTCVDFDHGGIDTATEKYKYNITGSSIDCSMNTVQHKLDQCLCDKKFAEDVGAMWDDNSFNTFFWHGKNNVKVNPVFDKEQTCVKVGGNANDACCGSFPSRRPYASIAMDCCNDGSLAAIGNC